MSEFNVADLTASLRLNKGSFDQDIQRSGQQVENLASKARTAGSSLGSLLRGGLTAASVATTGLITATGVMAAKVVATGVSYNMLQQNSRAALKTILGSTEAANRQMDMLDDFARNSPFAKGIFIKSQQQLLAFGMEAEKVIPTLDAVQQAIAASGGSSADLEGVVTTLAKIQSTGKVTAEDLNELGNRGIDAASLMGEAFGKTGAEMRDEISEGTVGADRAIQALTESMQKRFGGATAAVKQQMTGALDRVKGATRDIGAMLARPFVDPNGGGKAVEWTNQYADLLRALEGQIGPFAAMLNTKLAPAFAGVTRTLAAAKAEVEDFNLGEFNTEMEALGDKIPGIAGLAGAFLALSGSIPIVGGALGALGISLNPVVVGLVAAAAASPEVREALGDLLREAEPLLPVMGRLAEALAQGLTTGLLAVVPLIEALVPAIESAVKVGIPMVEFVSDLIGMLGDLPPELLTAGAAAIVMATQVGRIKDLGSSLFSPVIQGARQFRDEMQLQRSLAGGYSGGMENMGRTAETTATKFGTLGTAAYVAGNHIKNGLMGAGRNLVGFLGGPWGIAIMAGAAIVGMIAGAQAEAKQHVEELTGTLDEQTGAVTRLTTESVAAKLAQDSLNYFEWASGAKEAGDIARDLGTDLEGLASIITGSQAGYDHYLDLLRQFPGGYQESSMSMGQWAEAMGMSEEAASRLNAGAVNALIPTLEAEREAVMGSKDAHDQMNGAAEVSAQRTQDFADALGVMNDEASTGSEKVRALNDALDILNGKTPNADEAIRKLDDSTRNMNAALKDSEGNFLKLGDSVHNTTGQITTKTEAGSKLSAALADMVEKSKGAAVALHEEGAGADAVSGSLEAARQNWIDMAFDAGISAEEAIAAWDRMAQGSPDEISTIITADTTGVDDAVAHAGEVLGGMEAARAVATIAGDDKELGEALGRSFTNLTELDQVIATATAKLDPAEADAVRARILKDLMDLAATDPTVRAYLNPADLIEKHGDVTQRLRDLGNMAPEPKVLADIEQAKREVATIEQLLANIPDQTVSVNTVYTESGAKPQGYMARNGANVAVANGGIIKPFAAGGFHSPVPLRPMTAEAAMVPANTWRVVGDNLRVPEMYVPMDGSSRSLSILDQGLDQMGFSRVPKHAVQGYATGGFALPENTSLTPREAPSAAVRGADRERPANIYHLRIEGLTDNIAQEVAEVLMTALDHNDRGGAYLEVKN